MEIKTNFSLGDAVLITRHPIHGECEGRILSYEYDCNGLWVNVITPSANSNEIRPRIIKVAECYCELVR